jgi:polysaccharide pyruvyl transferase CsaB
MKILLIGYYGFDNLGDELLKDAAESILRKAGHQVKILNRSDRKVSKIYAMIKSVDAVVYAGGSLFQDVTGRGLSVLYYAFLIFLAKKINKKILLVGQGMGPIKKKMNLYILKKVFKYVDYISLRDQVSAAFLQALGINNYKLFTDFVFVEKLKIKNVNESDKKNIVFSFRQLDKDYSSPLYSLIKKIRDDLGVSIKLVSMQKNIDENVIKKMTDLDNVELVPYGREQIIKAIAKADLAVGMRLHFLILAAKLGIPFIGITYDPKVENLCKRLKMPFIQLSAMGRLPNLIKQELSKRKTLQAQLKVNAKNEELLAREMAADMLKQLKRAE